MKEKIKKWYPKLWTKAQVKNAVAKGLITPEDFEEITGEAYVAEPVPESGYATWEELAGAIEEGVSEA